MAITTLRLHTLLAFLLILAAVALTAWVYVPGLHGGFLFDDFPNIVDNTSLQVRSWRMDDWLAAALSSPASDMKRPLSMLTFAANAYWFGLDAFPLKLTNLCIHLANGLLLFAVLRTLIGAAHRLQRDFPLELANWAAALCVAIWLVLPINLTSVLYVVQRMESLAQTLVLLGLWLYVSGRASSLEGRSGGTAQAYIGLIVFTPLSILAKETGALLPLYAFLAEWTVFRFQGRDRNTARAIVFLYLVVLAVPMLYAGLFFAPKFFAPGAYGGRPFTLVQRLMSESRILVDYLQWILVPSGQALSFFHDDIPLSVSESSPPDTLWCQVVLGFLLLFGLALRGHRPLASLGILWFFAAHLLTATIIPLELIFEHRNYFASVGVVLAAVDLLFLAAPPPWARSFGFAFLLFAVVANAAVTRQRAFEWGDALRFAQSESENHPDSARAAYEYGRVLLIRSNYSPTSPLTDRAFPVLNRARALPGASTLPEQALILLAVHAGRRVDPAWWTGMADKLRRNPITQEDISALESLMHCQQNADCPPDHEHLHAAFEAAMSHANPSARLQSVYGDFAGSELNDEALAEKLMRGAVASSNGDPVYEYNLLRVLMRRGKKDDARDLIVKINLMELTSDLRTEVLEIRGNLGVTASVGPRPR